MQTVSPYAKCPVYESESFSLRLVQASDADDLLECYADPVSVAVMNSDNCNTDFHFRTREVMARYIGFWLAEYARAGYVRFAIVDRQSGKAVGTVEMFGRPGAEGYPRFGVLRIDLSARYEDTRHINELLGIAVANFYQTFDVSQIVTKAIPTATARVAALEGCGFKKLTDRKILPYDNYYIR